MPSGRAVMMALVFTAPGELEMRDVPEPEPADGEVLVHVRAAAICGSELHGARHPGFRVPPLIMGHEFAGISDNGDPVLINPLLSCGHCSLCGRGLRHLCADRALIGVHRPGGFAERVAVPAGAVRPLPDWLSWNEAAVVEPAANAVHAWNLARGGPGQRVAVLGCGAIGLLCLLTALAGGADQVEVTDLSPVRLAAARRLGAAAAGNTLTGEYDVVIDAVGSAVTRALSVQHQRPGGVAVWLGLAEQAAGFDALSLVRGEKSVLGSFAYTDDEFDRATALLRDADLSWVVPYPLAAGAQIFTELMNGRLDPVKALLSPEPGPARPGWATP
jgi:threonine dehydrogenase-like Zn-dependent dehydrogenase